MNTGQTQANSGEASFTLSEVMVAAVLVVLFFASMFELNAMSFRFMSSAKESFAALQTVHDRIEALRNLAFANLTRSTYLQDTVMPANYTPDGSPTIFWQRRDPSQYELVTISKYPTPSSPSPSSQFKRTTSSVTALSVASDLGSGSVKVDVEVHWKTLGGRDRMEKTSTIVSNGTKK